MASETTKPTPKLQRSKKRKGQTTNSSNQATESIYFTTQKKTKTCSIGDGTVKANRLGQTFYNQPCIKLAKALLGQTLVRILDDGSRLSGTIVETESYMGTEDSAAHTYQGHKSNKNLAMYMAPGTTYVYLIYGMYSCLNISSKGEGCAVLIRGLEPSEGLDTMTTHRKKRRKDTSRPLKPKDLCSGPGKLTEALNINKTLLDKKDLSTDTMMWIESGDSVDAAEIVACPRIGIDYATPEWVAKPLRFYIKGNSCVSKRDKKAESD
ncbi:DNA-3-methyladenine glycosylase-like [Amphiura filiformis]|uniref:DNA-3-methyladenine glycosylase-like n=1 Tax=Amphiura filiformis TaxID=82378 RepID=UPI003B20D8B3